MAAFNTLDNFGIHDTDISLEEAVEVAESARLSLYDASYLWLARSMNVELVTLDDKLKSAARA